MDVAEIAPGLWRWTGRHDGIAADVACVYQEGPDGIVVIDALVPPEDREHFLAALDYDVGRVGGNGVHILATLGRHERSAPELAARYGAKVWRRDETPLPNAIQAIECGTGDEVLFWLPEHGALVAGDVLRGRGGGLEVAGELAPSAVATLLALPVERVLVSHGEPVLGGGRAALRSTLGPAPTA